DRAAEGEHSGLRRLRSRHGADPHRARVRRQAEDAEQRLHQRLDQGTEGLADGGLAVDAASGMKNKWGLTPFIFLLCTFTAGAQSWPSKPIRFIVSFPPGGSSDLIARSIARKMGEKLGQQVVVENKPGAGGNIGVDAVAKSAPDGHTIGLAAAGALTVNPTLYASMPFDPQRDLAPISLLAMIPFLVIANPSAPPTLQELLVGAKFQPVMYGHG